jgi:hypothetical protein
MPDVSQFFYEPMRTEKTFVTSISGGIATRRPSLAVRLSRFTPERVQTPRVDQFAR